MVPVGARSGELISCEGLVSVYVNLVFRSYFTSPFLVLLGAKNSSEWLSCTKVAPPRLADDGRAGRPGAGPASAFGQGFVGMVVGACVKRRRAPGSGWACLPPPPTGPGASSLRQIRAFECSKSLKYMCLGVQMIL